MNRKYSWLIVLLVFTVASASAQNPRKHIRKGNDAFEEGNFADAEVDYRKAVSANPDYYKGKFNLGDAMYEQKNMEESGKIFSELAESAEKPEVKSNALYNLGNTLMVQKKYKEAMQAYKKSLLQNPKDMDAKYNYEYARKKMIEQQKQQQKNKDKNKDNKDKDKKKDKNKDQNKDKQKQDKQKQDKDKKDQNKDKQDKKQDKKNKQDQQNKDQKNQKGDQQKQKQQQNQPQQMSKKDAQRMLNALKNDEKKTLQKLQKKKAKAAKAKKSDIDW